MRRKGKRWLAWARRRFHTAWVGGWLCKEPGCGRSTGSYARPRCELHQ
jgi:hypothetical protein